MQYIADFTLG